MKRGVSSRHLIESSTPLSMDDIELVEEATGLNIDRSFDRVIEKELPEDTEAVTQMQMDSTTLIYDQEIPTETFAHESAHAEMLYPDGDIDLPGENIFDWKLYGEFVAYLAEDQIEPLTVSGSEKSEYGRSRAIYNDIKQDIEEIEKDHTLQEEWQILDDLEDREKREEAANAFTNYQENREQVVAPLAASKFDLGYQEVSDFIYPDEDTYHETINFIHEVEEKLNEGS